MKFREKLLILLAAVILSVLGFYLISSSFVDLHMMARKINNEKIESSHAKCDDAAYQTRHIIDRGFQFTRLSPYYRSSRARCTIGASE